MSIQTRTLTTIAPDGTALHSYLVLPKNSDAPAAGILVAPEWWGLAEHPKTVAENLAAQGFVALVMDLYGEGKLTTDAHQANAWMTQMLENSDELMHRCARICADFAALPEVATHKVGVVGFCFGGKIALDMARLGMPVVAVATFHGNPAPIRPADRSFAAKVLVAHGGADSMVSQAAIDELADELTAAGADFHIDVYEGAKHGFSNPYADARAAENGVDLAYHPQAAAQSWEAMLEFMHQHLA